MYDCPGPRTRRSSQRTAAGSASACAARRSSSAHMKVITEPISRQTAPVKLRTYPCQLNMGSPGLKAPDRGCCKLSLLGNAGDGTEGGGGGKPFGNPPESGCQQRSIRCKTLR